MSASRRAFLRLTAGGSVGLVFLLGACSSPAPAAPTAAPPAPAPTAVRPASTAPVVPAAPTAVPPAPTAVPARPASTLPAYLPGQIAPPDLPPSDAGLQAGYFSYPRQLVKTVATAPGSGGDVTAVVNTTSPLPPPMEDHAGWQALNKALNATMRLQLVASADYATKAATLMAGSDLPDLFYLGHNLTARGIPQFLKAQYTDLTPFLSGDAVKEYPNLAAFPTAAWSQATYDGAIYGIPVVRGAFNYVAYLNTARFDEVGAGLPENGDDYKRILQELTRPQSNQYGMAAIAPSYGLDYVGRGEIPWLARFGAPNNWAVDGAGKFTKDLETEQFKGALGYTRDLFAAGVFFPDPTLSQTTMRQQFLAGRIATMATGWNTNGSLLWDPGLKQTPAVPVRALRPFSMDGSPPIWHQSSGFNGLTALKKGSPERVRELLRIMNYFAAPFGSEEYQLINYGVEGVDFELDERHNPALTPRGQAEQTISVGWQYLTLPLPVLFNPNDAAFVRAAYEDEQAMVPVLIQDPSIGLYSETDISMTTQLTRPFFEGIGDIVVGRRPLADYDQLVATWRSAGGNQMRTEFERAYAEANPGGAR